MIPPIYHKPLISKKSLHTNQLCSLAICAFPSFSPSLPAQVVSKSELSHQCALRVHLCRYAFCRGRKRCGRVDVQVVLFRFPAGCLHRHLGCDALALDILLSVPHHGRLGVAEVDREGEGARGLSSLRFPYHLASTFRAKSTTLIDGAKIQNFRHSQVPKWLQMAEVGRIWLQKVL